ncbi:MAG TPA: hypothetical protein VJ608_14860, partial [Albitalea sp.]|nr:hypothetical protein [Albitalea sp.]
MRALCCLVALACISAIASAAPVALSDDELAGVSGRDGVTLAVHLELDTTLTAGFMVGGTKTYAVVQGLGGVLDLFTITLDVRSRPDGGDYIDIGLPGFIGAKQFGFKALGAQTDPSAPVAPSANYGALMLNGTGAMTGHVFLWGAP